LSVVSVVCCQVVSATD